MAASSQRSGYHQDYIARIRYSNALPPPPNPPKLLNIPGTGLASGQYTSAAYASRLSREQPLNIEADGELGMPIDLIGLPGVFDGDETALEGYDPPPQPHPHDKPLLRPLSMVGKPTSVASGVSFLRRTEYISSDAGGRSNRVESTTSRDISRIKAEARKRKREELERDDDPVRMLRGIYKGFDTAYPEDAYTGSDSERNVRGAEVTAEDRAAWDNPRHPSNPKLMPLDTYPLLPDLDTGNYFVMKFMSNPSNASDTYDSRLDVGLLRPVSLGSEYTAQHKALQQAYEKDPTLPNPGPAQFDYEFFLPDESCDIAAVKDMFDINEPTKHDQSNYSNVNDSGRHFFRYQKVRVYETNQQTGSARDPYGDSVAIALHDPADVNPSKTDSRGSRLQKGAYFYPLFQRTSLRPRRPAKAGVPSIHLDEADNIDVVELAIVDPGELDVSEMEIDNEAIEEPTAAVEQDSIGDAEGDADEDAGADTRED